jgi:hypothetical protein
MALARQREIVNGRYLRAGVLACWERGQARVATNTETITAAAGNFTGRSRFVVFPIQSMS